MCNFSTFCEQGREKKMSLVSSQTLSKGGESSLSGPQQHVAVQRSAIPLQEGKVTSALGCKWFSDTVWLKIQRAFGNEVGARWNRRQRATGNQCLRSVPPVAGCLVGPRVIFATCGNCFCNGWVISEALWILHIIWTNCSTGPKELKGCNIRKQELVVPVWNLKLMGIVWCRPIKLRQQLEMCYTLNLPASICGSRT